MTFIIRKFLVFILNTDCLCDCVYDDYDDYVVTYLFVMKYLYPSVLSHNCLESDDQFQYSYTFVCMTVSTYLLSSITFASTLAYSLHNSFLFCILSNGNNVNKQNNSNKEHAYTYI